MNSSRHSPCTLKTMRATRYLAATIALFMTLPLQAQSNRLTGTIVVTNKSPSTASVIDVESGRTIATLPTGRAPHEIAITTDGKMAVVTDYGTGTQPTLMVIDVDSMRVRQTIALGKYTAPHGIVLLRGDTLALVTSERSNTLVVVDIRNGNIVSAIDTKHPGSHMVGVTADATLAYTGDMRSATVTQLDLRSSSYKQSWTVPETPEAINVTPDGKEVWVGSNATGKVTVLDPATGAQRVAAEGVRWPYRVLFSKDTGTVVIPDMGNDEVRFLNRTSHKELARLSFPGGGPQGVTLTDDGRYLLLSLSKQARVAIIDMSSFSVVRHIDAGTTPDGIVYTSRVVSQPR